LLRNIEKINEARFYDLENEKISKQITTIEEMHSAANKIKNNKQKKLIFT